MKKVPNMKNIPIIRMTVSKAIVVAFVIAIITLFGSGVFNITQAQTPSAPSSPAPSSPAPSSPAPSSPAPSSPAPSSPAPTNKTALPPAIKAKICDPNNPKLAFVNTTESNICGLPKSIKNVTTTTPTTPTPTPSSPKPITPTPSSPKPITPPSLPKPITPPSLPKPITPPSEPSPPAEDIPGLP
jgi:hypothetical protein